MSDHYCGRCHECGWSYDPDGQMCTPADCSMRPRLPKSPTCRGCGVDLATGELPQPAPSPADRIRAIEIRELARLNYAAPDEDACTSFEEHVDEWLAADPDERAGLVLTHLEEGAERIRARILCEVDDE